MKSNYKNFTILPNILAQELELSLLALGLFCRIISHGNKWVIKVSWMQKVYTKESSGKIRSALKELQENHLLLKLKIQDSEKQRFGGTRYYVNWKLLENLMNSERKMEEENQENNFSDYPKFQKAEAPIINTSLKENEILNNTKIKKINQQQKKEEFVADAVFKIDVFFNQLLEEKEWHQAFLENNTMESKKMQEDELLFLFQHFKETSTRDDQKYCDLAAVKKHFSNWFRVQQTSGFILSIIDQRKKRQNSLLEKVGRACAIISRVQALYDARKFNDAEHVLTGKKILEEAMSTLQASPNEMFDQELRDNIIIYLENAKQMVGKIKAGKKADKLDWFFSNNL